MSNDKELGTKSPQSDSVEIDANLRRVVDNMENSDLPARFVNLLAEIRGRDAVEKHFVRDYYELAGEYLALKDDFEKSLTEIDQKSKRLDKIIAGLSR